MCAPAQAVHLIASDLRARYGEVSHMWIARKIETANFSKPVEFGGSRWLNPELFVASKFTSSAASAAANSHAAHTGQAAGCIQPARKDYDHDTEAGSKGT